MPDATQPTRMIPVWIAHDDARSTQVAMHLRSHDAYAAFVDRYRAEQRSSDMGDHWHRWADVTIDDIRYVVHDPEHYDTDPLADTAEARIAELHEMMGRVLLDGGMRPEEKIREIARLGDRIRDIAESDLQVRDDIRELSMAARTPAEGRGAA